MFSVATKSTYKALRHLVHDETTEVMIGWNVATLDLGLCFVNLSPAATLYFYHDCLGSP
jgi:hypothetical protein